MVISKGTGFSNLSSLAHAKQVQRSFMVDHSAQIFKNVLDHKINECIQAGAAVAQVAQSGATLLT